MPGDSNRSTLPLLLALLLLSGAQPSAVGVAIRPITFEKFKDTFLPVALKELQNRRFPDHRTSWNGIDFKLWDVILRSLSVDVKRVSLTFGNGQVCAVASDFQAYVTTRYEARWKFISTDGTASFRSKGSRFVQCIRPKIAPGSKYDIEGSRTEADVNDFDIHIDGGFIGQLINFFKDIFKPIVKRAVNEALTDALRDFINGDLRKLVQSVPTEIMVDEDSKTLVDYSPATLPNVEAGIFYETNAFFFGPETRGKLPPFPIPGPLELPKDDFPVVLTFHEFVFQDFLWSYFTRHPLDIDIRDQKDFPIKLNVETFAVFFENLETNFSLSTPVAIRLRTTDFPKFEIQGDSLKSYIAFNATLSAVVFDNKIDFSFVEVGVQVEMVPVLVDAKKFEVKVSKALAKDYKFIQVGSYRLKNEHVFLIINAVVDAYLKMANPTITIPITGFPNEIILSRTGFLIDGRTLKLRTDVDFKVTAPATHPEEI